MTEDQPIVAEDAAKEVQAPLEPLNKLDLAEMCIKVRHDHPGRRGGNGSTKRPISKSRLKRARQLGYRPLVIVDGKIQDSRYGKRTHGKKIIGTRSPDFPSQAKPTQPVTIIQNGEKKYGE